MSIMFGIVTGFILWVYVRRLLAVKVGFAPTAIFILCIVTTTLVSARLDGNFLPLWQRLLGPG